MVHENFNQNTAAHANAAVTITFGYRMRSPKLGHLDFSIAHMDSIISWERHKL